MILGMPAIHAGSLTIGKSQFRLGSGRINFGAGGLISRWGAGPTGGNRQRKPCWRQRFLAERTPCGGLISAKINPPSGCFLCHLYFHVWWCGVGGGAAPIALPFEVLLCKVKRKNTS